MYQCGWAWAVVRRPGSGGLVLECEVWNLKYDIFNLESGFQNLKCGILNLGAHICSPESEVRGLTSPMWNWRSLDCIRSRRRPDGSSFSQIAQASHIFLLSPQLHKYHRMQRAFYPRSYTSFPELTPAFLFSLQSGRAALDLQTQSGQMSRSGHRKAGR